MDIKELCAFSQTSKHWYIITQEQSIWESLCLRNWPSSTLKQEKTWKDLLKKNLRIEHQIQTSTSPGVTAISLAIEQVYNVRLGVSSTNQAHWATGITPPFSVPVVLTPYQV